MKEKAKMIIKKSKCLDKLASMACITPLTLIKFADGTRSLSPDQVQAVVAAAMREEMITGRPAKKRRK